MKSAQELYGDSLGRIKDQLQNGRIQIEGLAEQLPKSQQEAKAHTQEMAEP